MFSITHAVAPQDSLLRTYGGGANPERWGTYADCFSVEVDRVVSLSDFVFSFYTSPVFRMERLMLRVMIGAKSSDAQTRALAEGSSASFAAWNVADRTATQLLMCDRYERTRSWFRVVPMSGARTLLQFGSAMAASGASDAARGRGFKLLLGLHVLYSQVLLNSARIGVLKAERA